MIYFVFKNKETGLYHSSCGDVENPEDAYPKIGDRGSAFMYADERYEGQVELKMAFKRTYEICEVK